MADKQKERERGIQAEHLLKDPMLQEALSAIRDTVLDDFKTCDPADTEWMQELRMLLYATDKFEQFLQKTVNLGKFAAEELEDERASQERKREQRIIRR